MVVSSCVPIFLFTIRRRPWWSHLVFQSFILRYGDFLGGLILCSNLSFYDTATSMVVSSCVPIFHFTIRRRPWWSHRVFQSFILRYGDVHSGLILCSNLSFYDTATSLVVSSCVPIFLFTIRRRPWWSHRVFQSFILRYGDVHGGLILCSNLSFDDTVTSLVVSSCVPIFHFTIRRLPWWSPPVLKSFFLMYWDILGSLIQCSDLPF
ncbi:hypothetical protein BgiMline_035207 [Biomphalaria glabrata]|nr:hypothetical protein BgiMline_026076 [Biomphalaria glabrata]